MDLRWYQSEACTAAWTHLCGQAGNPVIVLPTGAGKSIVIAELCRKAVDEYQGRVIVVAHRKELLEQNAAKVQALVSHPVGLFSAGLRRNQVDEHIVVAGIQSIYKKAHHLGARHLVLIDEVHLVPRNGEGMYRTFLNELRAINPQLRMIGLTATPFRTGEGSLCRSDGLFQKICYDAPIQQLIAEGFLCQVTNQPAKHEVNTAGLHLRGGEFIPLEVEQLFSGKAAVLPACREIVEKTRDRKSVLIFCSGIDHAEQVAAEIERLTGEHCGVVIGGTPPLERIALLNSFKEQRLRFLCNVDVLTTGFDAPCVDAIAILRATNSPGLFAQICGRGLRTHSSKTNCLLLDFGENFKRHGPIDAIDYGRDRQSNGQREPGDAPEKTCPNCEQSVSVGVLECECGFRFPEREPKHSGKADDSSQVLAAPEVWEVLESMWSKHYKKRDANAPPTLRIDYRCRPVGGNLEETISEWVCIEHEGFARTKAAKWWREQSRSNPPVTIDDAIYLMTCGATVCPHEITTVKEGHFKRITFRKLDELPETWREEPASSFEDEVGDWNATEEAPF